MGNHEKYNELELLKKELRISPQETIHDDPE